jgi:hypothetical protein
MSNLDNALKKLREKRSQAQAEIDKLDQIISGIESLNGTGVIHKPAPQSRVIYAASRRKMALAQKARWAKGSEWIETASQNNWLVTSQVHNVSGSPSEDCGGTNGTLGKDTGCKEGGVASVPFGATDA